MRSGKLMRMAHETAQPEPPRIPVWAKGLIAVSNFYRRLLAIALGLMGPRAAYTITGYLARKLYHGVDVLRQRSETQCAAALGGQKSPAEIVAIAEASFVHRIWNLVDLMLADRLIHRGTYARFGGHLPEAGLAQLLAAQQRRQPVIFVTLYYGPFDLLPLFLGYSGLKVCAVYKRHPNAEFDAYRTRIRRRSGCELVPIEQAAQEFEKVLARGGSVAILADHHADRRGMPATFLGLPTQAMRTVGLLAWRYQADVVVAGIRRVDRSFRFELLLTEVIDHGDWQNEADPVAYVTHRYLRGLERIVAVDPQQYLWAYSRWGQDTAAQLASQTGQTQDEPGA